MIVVRINACRGGKEDALDFLSPDVVQDIQVDSRRVLHDDSVIHARMGIFDAPHVGSELKDLVEALIEDVATEIRVPKVTNHEFVRLGWRELKRFLIDATNPQSILPQAPNQVPAYKPPSSTDQRRLHFDSTEVGSLTGVRFGVFA